MNLGFDAGVAVGGVIGGFLTLLFIAAWCEAKRDRWMRKHGEC